MNKKKSDLIIEALLFASPTPLNQSQLNQVFNNSIPNLKEAIDRLNNFYSNHNRSYLIEPVAGGYQLVTKSDMIFGFAD